MGKGQTGPKVKLVIHKHKPLKCKQEIHLKRCFVNITTQAKIIVSSCL